MAMAMVVASRSPMRPRSDLSSPEPPPPTTPFALGHAYQFFGWNYQAGNAVTPYVLTIGQPQHILLPGEILMKKQMPWFEPLLWLFIAVSGIAILYLGSTCLVVMSCLP
jgi:hypothetical protein